jgi:hypothetical protein
MTNSFSADIRAYALAGATARLSQLSEEAEQIRRLFPELARAGKRGISSPDTGSGTNSSRRRRRRRTMSAAQRKAVGERMKKYWAARRGGTATETPAAAAGGATTSSKGARAQKRLGPRTMSAEARKRISDAQKARWAKQRGEAKATSAAGESTGAAKGRRGAKRSRQGAAKRRPRTMSAAARKRISQAQKKRWAAPAKPG